MKVRVLLRMILTGFEAAVFVKPVGANVSSRFLQSRPAPACLGLASTEPILIRNVLVNIPAKRNIHV
jgi:hypothetical protein